MKKRGYITTIRNAWHILPYDQLLKLLGWDEAKLAIILKEDDFLAQIAREEEQIALATYALMQKNSLIGYEAANHYYYNRGVLAEKVIVCRELIKKCEM